MKSPEVIHICIVHPDQSVAVMHFVVSEYDKTGAPRWYREPTTDEIAKEVTKYSLVPGNKPVKEWHIVTLDEIPKERSTRNSWRFVNGKIVANGNK